MKYYQQFKGEEFWVVIPKKTIEKIFKLKFIDSKKALQDLEEGARLETSFAIYRAE